MKLNRKNIRKMILKEMASMGQGSFYDTTSGAMFDRLLGVQGLMDELEAASIRITRIQEIAERCLSETMQDSGDFGYVGDQQGYDFFQNMIDRCERIREQLDYQNFLR